MRHLETIMFELGSLKVYHLDSLDNEMQNGFYWKDNDSPVAFGPFPTIYDAVNHYKTIIKQMRSTAGTVYAGPLKPEIKVDFVNKKRI